MNRNMVQLKHSFEDYKEHLREQLQEEYEAIAKDLLRNEQDRYAHLLEDYRGLQSLFEKARAQEKEKENDIQGLKKKIEEKERDIGMKQYHINKVEESYILVVEENKRLVEDNKILVEEVRELMGRKNVSTADYTES